MPFLGIPTFATTTSSNSSQTTPPPPQQPRPTIILVPGAWQGPETFTLLIPFLESAHYSTFTISLPSIGTVPATTDFARDVAAVRSAVTATLLTGKDVLLVMHSWGAVVGCEALKDIEMVVKEAEEKRGINVGKVVKLAFIAGLVFPVGKSALDPRSDAASATSTPGLECVNELISVIDGPTRFYNDLPPPIAAQWASRLQLHSRLSFLSPLTYAAYKYYPCAYLTCKHDAAVPFAVQRKFVAAAGITDVVMLESGHSPMVSQPEEVARWIRGCAGEEGVNSQDGKGKREKARL